MGSPNNTDSSVEKGKTGSTPKTSSSGRDYGRKKTNRNVVTPYNFDAKHYNNPAVKLCLVFPGEADLTSFFTHTTIPMNRFVCGRDHPSANLAVKQAIWDMIINSLSGVIPIDTPLKQGFHSLVKDLYSKKSIGNETFCFAPKLQLKTTFTFLAAMKFILRRNVVFHIATFLVN